MQLELEHITETSKGADIIYRRNRGDPDNSNLPSFFMISECDSIHQVQQKDIYYYIQRNSARRKQSWKKSCLQTDIKLYRSNSYPIWDYKNVNIKFNLLQHNYGNEFERKFN